eukprot:766932-Hanusia_phi.AAC.9
MCKVHRGSRFCCSGCRHSRHARAHAHTTSTISRSGKPLSRAILGTVQLLELVQTRQEISSLLLSKGPGQMKTLGSGPEAADPVVGLTGYHARHGSGGRSHVPRLGHRSSSKMARLTTGTRVQAERMTAAPGLDCGRGSRSLWALADATR